MRNIFLYLLLTIFLFVQFSCSPTYLEKCGNGNPVILPRDPAKAERQLYWAKEYIFEAEATVDIVDEVKIGDGKVQFKKAIKDFRDTLTNETVQILSMVQSTSRALSSNPCSLEMQKIFYDLQKNLVNKTTALQKFKLELDKLNNSDGIGVSQKEVEIVTTVGKFEDKYFSNNTNDNQ